MASSGSGKWEDSGGDVSKFGLTSSELLEALDFLEKNKLKNCLKLVHFHVGSQVTKIRRIKIALRESSQFYVELCKMGFNIQFVDIGGGLGVDYDGTRSADSGSSVNYSIQEYVNDAVATMVDAADKNNLPHPNVITESGRSLTAHHSVLIFEVWKPPVCPRGMKKRRLPMPTTSWCGSYTPLGYSEPARMLETWHDAQQIREEALDRFSLGILDIKTRAQVERLFWSIARDIHALTVMMKHVPDELRSLPKLLSDKYFCNFSLFQSLPDSWAMDQIFPVIPIQRLD